MSRTVDIERILAGSVKFRHEAGMERPEGKKTVPPPTFALLQMSPDNCAPDIYAANGESINLKCGGHARKSLHKNAFILMKSVLFLENRRNRLCT